MRGPSSPEVNHESNGDSLARSFRRNRSSRDPDSAGATRRIWFLNMSGNILEL